MNHAFTQTPREVRHRKVGYDCYLDEGETLVGAAVTVTPPPGPLSPNVIPQAFDQRIELLDTSGWLPDGIKTSFPLVSPSGVSLKPIARQYVQFWDGDVPYRPDTDFEVAGAQITFYEPLEADGFYWGMVQNPIVNNELYNPVSDPPYTAFACEAYIVAPDNREVLLVSEGGAAPLVYKVKLLVETSLGKRRETRVDFRIREP